MYFPKCPHGAMFVGATNVGKTECLLRILETEHKNHFEFIVIMRPTILDNNKAYLSRKWIFEHSKRNDWLVISKTEYLLRILEK